jgi:hypothetical protein
MIKKMAKYPLTELGHVAKDFTSRHILTFIELGTAISEATGVEIKESSFQQARRDERGYEPLRELIMDYMRKLDPELVESSLAAYNTHYRKGA